MPGWWKKAELIHLYLVGLMVQCIHFVEEFTTGFQTEYPRVFGAAAWSDRFFVTLNLVAMAVFLLAALGLLLRVRAARGFVWLFALAMCINGLGHPALSLWKGAYFPGTITAPLHFVVGVLLLRKLSEVPSDGRCDSAAR